MALEFTEQYRHCNDVDIEEDQIEGINFLLKRVGGILAFGTGLGKTLTALVAMKILLDKFHNTKCVVVCPVKAVKAFRKELFNRLKYSKEDVGIISTDVMDFDVISNKVIIVTDTNIEKYKEVVVDIAARNFKILLIIDEAHKLQDNESKFYITMQEVKSICTLCWGMTATPILNDLDSLYYIVEFFCPGFLGKKTRFEDTYTIWHLRDQYMKGGRKKKVKELDGYKNLDKLNEVLKEVMIVRQKQYNLRFGNVFRDLSSEEYEVYEKVSSGILFEGDESREFTKRLHDLQRFVDRSFDEDVAMMAMVKQYHSKMFSTKETMFLETIKKTLGQGYSVIVYADYHTTIERLEKVLLLNKDDLDLNEIYKVTGKIDIRTREKVEEQIGDKDVILITSAGSESINLQRANCIIFYDIPFSTKTIIQVVGRVCRRDTLHPYQYIITLYTKGTVDEYKYMCFQGNLAMIQASVGAGSDLPLNVLDVDKKNVQNLKNTFLWHYKGDDKKIKRKNKKIIKENLGISTPGNADKYMVKNKFIVEPIAFTCKDATRVDVLLPDMVLYEKFCRGEIPFPVLRAKYLEYLRSGKGRDLIQKIQFQLLSSPGILLLIGETDIPKVLMEEILEQYVV